MCTQCLKTCPHDNLRFSTRRPFADFFSAIDLRPAQLGFILLLSGCVVYEILSEWPLSFGLMMWLPDHLTRALAITGSMANFASATIMFVALPALALLGVAALAQLVSGRRAAPIGATAKAFALLLLPTIAAAHIIKSMLKMSSRIPYWRSALSDPKGIETAQSIVNGTLALDTSVADVLDPVVSLAAVAVLALALAATVQIFRRSALTQKHSPGVKVVLLLSVLAYWSIFGLTILRWRFG